MNKYVKWAAWGGGGVALFGAAYVGFALAMGGNLGGEPPHENAGTSTATIAEHASETVEHPEPPSAEPLHTSKASLLDVFQMASPFSAAELEELQSELKAKNKDLERRATELEERERRTEARDQLLDQRQIELQKLRDDIERRELELDLRRAEVDRDESAKTQRDQVGWAKLAKLFSEGDASELGAKLGGYTPEDAAKVLDQLKPARARELLDALGPDKWKEYAEAYRKLTAPSQE